MTMTQRDQRDNDRSAEAIRDLSGDAPQVDESERRKAIRKLQLRFAKKPR